MRFFRFDGPIARHPIALWLLFLVVGAAGISHARQAVDLILPLDKAVVGDDSLLIIGKAPRGATIEWSIERQGTVEKDKVKADWGDLFEIFVLLEPGLNRITVGSRGLEVFYDTGGGTPPPGFGPQRVHAGDVSRCEDCHGSLHAELHEGGYPGVCLLCHVVVSVNPDDPGEAEDDPHFKAAITNCGSCHEAHVARDRQLLRADAQELCGRCHSERRGTEETHPAYEEGGCSACHDAHYSGYPNSLHEPPPGLCNRCHDQGTEEGQVHPPVVHDPSCVLCHASHGSGAGLLQSATGELCSACHAKVLEQGHGEELAECNACHDQHGRLGTGLLKEELDISCAECHDDVGSGRTVHPALEEGCQTCHNPHVDENVARARVSCPECHDMDEGGELASLHGNLEIPPAACMACHPPHASAFDQLIRGKLHYPLTQGKCSVCHGGGAERAVLVDNVADRCRMCHSFEKSLEAEQAQIHDPVSEGECTSCHDPHMSTEADLLKSTQPETCAECHDVTTPTGGKRWHPPATNCSECHEAHGGRNPYFLPTAPPELCMECHEDPREALGEIHPALDEGCLTCHDPHAGFPPGFTRGKTPYSACLECHEIPDLSEGKTFHPPAEECSGCHNPHGGSEPSYLGSGPPDLCLECHDDPRARGSQLHPAVEEGCLACHDPHTGYASAILTAPEKDLCLECHDDPTAGKSHPHAAANEGCSGCHDPHASDQDRFLRAEGTALCRACHDFSERKPGRALHPAAEICTDCHSDAPHGGYDPQFLPSRPPDLCVECHEDPRETSGELHPALEDGCLVCHDPHAGLARGLLRGDTLAAVCLACHDDPAAGKNVLHPALTEGCATCHEPHASENGKFLAAPGNALCVRCHDLSQHKHSVQASRGARFPGAAGFPVDGDEYACIGCHAPHASDEAMLHPRPRDVFCAECHPI